MKCKECSGKGVIVGHYLDGSIGDENECPSCNGTGEVEDDKKLEEYRIKKNGKDTKQLCSNPEPDRIEEIMHLEIGKRYKRADGKPFPFNEPVGIYIGLTKGKDIPANCGMPRFKLSGSRECFINAQPSTENFEEVGTGKIPKSQDRLEEIEKIIWDNWFQKERTRDGAKCNSIMQANMKRVAKSILDYIEKG
jgi:hypothetical protein